MYSRRQFVKILGLTGAVLVVPGKGIFRQAFAESGKKLLEAAEIPKFVTPLIIPPAMPRTGKIRNTRGKNTDYYEIAVRQFSQQILPPSFPTTTVWSYGSASAPGTFNYPAFTIEAKHEAPVQVKWVNELVDASGNYLPHLLPVDQTLHWANPPGGETGRDSRGTNPAPYLGPVPLVTHVHGAHTGDESDGNTEGWFLPQAGNIPAGYARQGTWYDYFSRQSLARNGVAWSPGSSLAEYPNRQRATTLWYHDHSLGMTRLNVYAGPAGFYIIRGGPSDQVLDAKGKKPAVLPGPAPASGDAPGTQYFEIPLAIQDRAFYTDGSLFYPATRAFFEGLEPEQLDIPFIPQTACDGEASDISPIWNPEFFGNTMVVNGRTWPYLEVERRRYRFRLLNGCNSRFLLLQFSQPVPVWQIGSEGGFLPQPVRTARLLMAPAERADVIVDFSEVPPGTGIELLNLGPDEPFGGGEPGNDFDPADDETTGQVMQFRVVKRKGADPTTPPERLVLPTITPLGEASLVRKVSLNEESSHTVKASVNEDGVTVLDCEDGELFGPRAALLGTVMEHGDGEVMGMPMMWMDEITENPAVGATEIWEIYNFTMDAHPIHIHEVMFEVLNRQPFHTGDMATRPGEGHGPRMPEPSERGLKDTVIAYPGEITRIKAMFDLPGLYVWHCHIVEHEDNEMMRPYAVGPVPSPR